MISRNRFSANRREQENSAMTSFAFNPEHASIRIFSTAFSTSLSILFIRREDCRRIIFMGAILMICVSHGFPLSIVDMANSPEATKLSMNVESVGFMRSAMS